MIQKAVDLAASARSSFFKAAAMGGALAAFALIVAAVLLTD